MIRPELIERINTHLFSSIEEMNKAHIQKSAQDRLLRLREMYMYWLHYPMKTEREISDAIKDRFRVNYGVAWEDVQLIKICLGNVNKCTLEYARYRFVQLIEKGVEMAIKNNNDKSVIAAAAAWGKYNKLDHDVPDKLPYSEIVPTKLEPTDDPTVIGLKPIANLRDVIKKMQEKYSKEDVEYADFEEANTIEENDQEHS